MDNDGGFTSYIVFFVVMILVVWEIDYKPWSNEYTTHVQRKSCIEDKCEWLNVDRMTWRINENNNEVVSWNEDKDTQELSKSKNCTIRDRKNWVCPIGISTYRGVSDGDYWFGSSIDKTIWTRNVYKIEWWLANLATDK